MIDAMPRVSEPGLHRACRGTRSTAEPSTEPARASPRSCWSPAKPASARPASSPSSRARARESGGPGPRWRVDAGRRDGASVCADRRRAPPVAPLPSGRAAGRAPRRGPGRARAPRAGPRPSPEALVRARRSPDLGRVPGPPLRGGARAPSAPADERPLVLVLEDIHWADAASRDLVRFLARNARGASLLVVATYRSDELHRRHALLPLLAELQRLDQVDDFELTAFGADEVAAQLAGITGEAVRAISSRRSSRGRAETRSSPRS